MSITVFVTLEVDEAILSHIDYVDIDAISAVLNSIENAKNRFIDTISTFPEAGAKFTANAQFLAFDGYVFVYDFDRENNQVNVLDIFFPGQNWR